MKAVNTSKLGLALCGQLAFVLLAVWLWASPASATASCLVADPADPTLNVRDAPRGKVINRLKNGRNVFILENRLDARNKLWAKVGGAYRGTWREWGWVFQAHLKCSIDGALESRTGRVEKVHTRDLAANGIGWFVNLGVACPYQGEGHTLSFAPDFVSQYTKQGFSLTAMCLGLASEGVNYDPEDGTPIAQYEPVGEDGISGRYPFFLPRCFRSVRILAGQNTAWVRWKPDGCTLTYHPVTGKRLRNSGDVVVTTGAEAGDASPEPDADTSVTNARLRALLRRN